MEIMANIWGKNIVATAKLIKLNIVFFTRILESLPPLPRQHSAAIGCTKNFQPIGVTVHSHCVESFEGLLQRYVDEGGVAVNCEKTQFFLNTLY